jgi:hypothetical protein
MKLYSSPSAYQTLQGRYVYIPTEFIYDGTGQDLLGSVENIKPTAALFRGHTNMIPTYGWTDKSHSEIAYGHIFENPTPGVDPHLVSQFGHTYHYLWFHLNKFLDPEDFRAFCPGPGTRAAGDIMISWDNRKDTMGYELWAKREADPWVRIKAGIPPSKAGDDITGLSPGDYKIKVRALRYNGTWRDSDSATMLGMAVDPAHEISLSLN